MKKDGSRACLADDGDKGDKRNVPCTLSEISSLERKFFENLKTY